jgi:hypothetical protein
MSIAVEQVFHHALSQIERAEIFTEPFPHISINRFLPDDFFQTLLRHIPERSHFQKVFYPGSGFDRKATRYHGYGWACKDFSGHQYFKVVKDLFASDDFSKLLLEKFSRKLADGLTPIPPEKHTFFKDGANDYTCVFDFQIDLPGYEIPPHPDIKEKIVTFQLFLVEDESLRDYGTLLCKPKNGRATTRRSMFANLSGQLLDGVTRVLQLRQNGIYSRLKQSGFGLWAGLGPLQEWLPWELFDVAKVLPALPNHFMAFAPNSRSYHAVRMDIPAANERQERPVIRGFIRNGRNAKNWMMPADL